VLAGYKPRRSPPRPADQQVLLRRRHLMRAADLALMLAEQEEVLTFRLG
jgi:hypothetical protein